MAIGKISSEHFSIFKHTIRWSLLTIPVAACIGSVVAFFLWLLDIVTHIRWQHSYLLYLLPIAGIAIYFLYKLFGKNSERGNNLIIEEIHEPGGGVPARMAPLVLISTIITHLFGGSAGREGTAVQMGGSIASAFAKWLKLSKEDVQILLTAGIAAGFGAVFGTPVTGSIFAMEVLAIGIIQYNAILPCLIAGVTGHVACSVWGIHHTEYHIAVSSGISHTLISYANLWLLAKTIIAGIAFGLASFLFIATVHRLKSTWQAVIKIEWLIPVAGAALIILLCFLLQTNDYLGLGVTSNNANGVSIVSSFAPGGATSWSWFWKLLFTAITLSSGFKGGEVTPLFFIGAALGNTLATIFHVPIDLFAGLGFIAVFAGATNTPLACTIMGVELFGGEHILLYAVACFTAYLFSGHASIYNAQKIEILKAPGASLSLKEAEAKRKAFRKSLLDKINKPKP
ncbi:MAG: voltage-gated chloride channel family protein [Filimonas sp.]|nr:voltage-gated chloride channel family protein [Filimonas sp.]